MHNSYVRQHYQSYRYKYESYIYFIEKGVKLAAESGTITFITPELWLRLENGFALRKFISQYARFELLRVYGENVFEQATVNTVVIFLRRGGFADALNVEILPNNSWKIKTTDWQNNNLLQIDYRIAPEAKELIRKIDNLSTPLDNFGNVIQGLTPYDQYQGQEPELIKRRGYHFDYKKDDTCGKWLRGKHISRYLRTWDGEWLSYGPWLAAPRDESFFQGPRLLFREIPGKNKRIQATYVEETLYYGHSITPFKLHDTVQSSIQYILAIANSNLISWYGKLILPNFGKDIFPKLNPSDIKQLPIRTLDFSNFTHRSFHDQIVDLVEQLLALHEELLISKKPQKTNLEQQISIIDSQIDELIYHLYGLTPAEIAIVEGKP